MIKCGYEFIVCIKYCVSTHGKKLIKFWSICVMQLRKSRFFCLARGVLLDNGVTSPWVDYIIRRSRCVPHLQKLVVFHEICEMQYFPWGIKLGMTLGWMNSNNLYVLQEPSVTSCAMTPSQPTTTNKGFFDPFELNEFISIFVLDRPFQINMSNVNWNQPHPCIHHQTFCHQALNFFWHHYMRSLRHSSTLWSLGS